MKPAHPHVAAREPRNGDHSHWMFILCSESAASAEFAAAFPTAYVLQALGTIPIPIDDGTRATIEYGLFVRGVRHLVVCGHEGCHATERLLRTHRSDPAQVVAQCKALQRDELLGPILRRADVTMHALWFEELSRDVYACDFDGRPARRLDGQDALTLLASVDEGTE